MIIVPFSVILHISLKYSVLTAMCYIVSEFSENVIRYFKQNYHLCLVANDVLWLFLPKFWSLRRLSCYFFVILPKLPPAAPASATACRCSRNRPGFHCPGKPTSSKVTRGWFSTIGTGRSCRFHGSPYRGWRKPASATYPHPRSRTRPQYRSCWSAESRNF